MFNILSGLQEGSHSVMITQRSGAAGFVKGTVVNMSSTTANTIAKADATAYGKMVEFVFEDLTTQSSGKYTVVAGTFEAETDQISGTPAIGDYLKVGTGGTAGLLLQEGTPTTPALTTVAKVTDKYTVTDNTTGTSTTVYRIRTV